MKHRKTTLILIVVLFAFIAFSSSFGVECFYLTITIDGSGTVNKNPDLIEFVSGDNVTLTAVTDKGWKFNHWEGDLTGSENPVTITMDDDKDITAVFVKVSNTGTYLLLLDEE